MKVLTQYTLRCLGRNRVRTLVTVIGILLSVALFTAVSEGAYSGQQYLLHVAEAREGSYYGLYSEVNDRELSELSGQKDVRRVETMDSVGWAVIAPENDMFPYLRIYSMSEGLTDLLAINLLQGRMPQNDSEILISDRLNPSTGAELSVGQKITLTVGQRVSGENVLGDKTSFLGAEEHLENTTEKTYTVVGMYARLSSAIESFELPGSLALTVGSGGDSHIAFFTLKNVKRTHEFLSAHRWGTGSDVNRDYLLFSGSSGNGNIVSVFNGLVGILFGLILFGSVALIYNSFSISVSERTRQFGLLKSIGATKRQIRRTVITEALLLCVVAIPAGLLVGCLGIGLTLGLLKDKFSLIIAGLGAEQVRIRLVPYLPALLSAAGIGLVTALLSAWIPARRAVKIPPISTIRQSEDLKVNRREVRISPLTRKLFGFPGMLASKYFKRNRKRYRATVVSLFLSIVLFISAYSFAGYLRNDVAQFSNEYASDLIVSFSPAEAAEDREALLRELSAVDGITEGAFADLRTVRVRVDPALLTEDAKKHTSEQGAPEFYGTLFFVSDAYYTSLCKEAGVKPDGSALVRGKVHGFDSNETGTVYFTYEVLRSSALPSTVTVVQEKTPEGYYLDRIETDDAGEITCYVFLPEEGGEAAKELRLAPDQAEMRTELSVSGSLENAPLAAGQDEFSLYLPISRQNEVLGSAGPDYTVYFFNAADHSAAGKSLQERLEALGKAGTAEVRDTREGRESTMALLLILDVFTFGFIVLISLIAAANVFNTISTNISLRQREFATLKSVGMDQKSFGRMMRFECLLYGMKALALGIPVSVGISWLIYRSISNAFSMKYHLPWAGIGIAALSVFLVVGVTMLYATHKLNRQSPVETLRNENI